MHSSLAQVQYMHRACSPPYGELPSMKVHGTCCVRIGTLSADFARWERPLPIAQTCLQEMRELSTDNVLITFDMCV